MKSWFGHGLYMATHLPVRQCGWVGGEDAANDGVQSAVWDRVGEGKGGGARGAE